MLFKPVVKRLFACRRTTMKYFVFFFLGFTAVHCNDKNLLEDFSDGNNRFSSDVYKEIKAIEDGNFVFCSLSAEIILGLTRFGARGTTGAQLSKGLHLPDDANKIERIFKALTPKLKNDEGYILNSANRIYLQDGYKIREDFKNTAQNSFLVDVKNIDLKKKEDSSGEINLWVLNQTHGKIKNLIDPKMLSEDSRSVLVNALYFKGAWNTKHSERVTKLKPFYLNNNTHVDVDMVEVTDFFMYYSNDELKANFLEIPYASNEYSMVLVLPHEKEGLAELENKLGDVLSAARGQPAIVHVQVPKFKIESKVKLTNILKNLGVKDAFEDYADLSGFTEPGQQPLKIGDVIQKVIIEFDEEGTTSAASAIMHAAVSYAMEVSVIQEFNADHPFIYYIKGPNGVMLIGRYVQK
ncbi:hypothetical protein RN001_014925 [Aquatica leii]|uniref:Serpin domain-containing protein n=1 Tax=Aquatica leii TaxID=1421715 RepID=A0AAN7S6F3_9COLE|nr:hypothetical protein RN001_014925 [Aquatica leii]